MKKKASFCAAILTIGNELLQGRTVNTNTAFLGNQLTQLGFHVTHQQSCPDEISAIQNSLKQLSNQNLVIVTGGLGPTPDDLTREAMAAHFSSPLQFSMGQFLAMSRVYKKLGKKLPELSKREAYYPACAHPLINRFGIALGFWLFKHKQMVVVLPGVPTELRKMFEHDVRPLLKKKYPALAADFVLTVRMVGISEPNIIEKLGADFFDRPFQFGIYPSEGETQICIRSSDQKIVSLLKKKIKERLKGYIYAWDDQSLATQVGKWLVLKNKTLAVAESCTGGSLAFAFTREAGASHFFLGGMTTYHRKLKLKLGVKRSTLQKYGEVSEPVAAELAQAACKQFHSDYGLGVTGIAGPSGGSRDKPVGLVYIAVAIRSKVSVHRHLFWGNREQIQRKAVSKSIEILWRLLSVS